MPRSTAIAARPATSEQVKRTGAYLTDGIRLYRVVDSREGEVALENCRVPDENPQWMRVVSVLKEMRLVRPLRK